jgi:predicted Zn-dependent protease
MVHGVRLLFASVLLLAGLALGIQRVEAQTDAETLDLLGVGWAKSPVTVQIKAAGGVTDHAIDDVVKAIEDWNAVLKPIVGVKEMLQLVSNVKKADITIQMKVGGGVTLGSAGSRTTSPFTCELNSASIQLSGKAFGQAFSSVGTQNVARHEIGHALGLGHSNDPTDLMYPTFETSEFLGDTDRPISQCDKNGLEAIYPRPTSCTIPDSITCP